MEDVMKFRTLVVASVAAMALSGSPAAAATAELPAQCEVQQRQLLRVAMSIAVGQTAVDTTAVARVVDRLWAREGVDIDWIGESEVAADHRLDAWIVVGRRATESSTVPVRDNNVGHRVVAISLDDVIRRFEQSLSLQMQVSRESARHLMFGNAHLIERSLGYAVAHKLGHSVMGLTHAAAGLMSDDYNSMPGLTGVGAPELDGENRRLLQKRFGVGCVTAR
jgi:hypothetical protein